MNSVRHSIPERCDAAADWIAPNGYCACDEHRDIGLGPECKWSRLPEPERCDYPVDGLGAAPYRRPDRAKIS